MATYTHPPEEEEEEATCPTTRTKHGAATNEVDKIS